MEFDYEIQNKSGSENRVADALSRVQGSEVLLMPLSVLHSDLHLQNQKSYDKDLNLLQLVFQLR